MKNGWTRSPAFRTGECAAASERAQNPGHAFLPHVSPLPDSQPSLRAPGAAPPPRPHTTSAPHPPRRYDHIDQVSSWEPPEGWVDPEVLAKRQALEKEAHEYAMRKMQEDAQAQAAAQSALEVPSSGPAPGPNSIRSMLDKAKLSLPIEDAEYVGGCLGRGKNT